MKATAELPSQAEKSEPDIVFSCICSNEFKILYLFLLYYHICRMLYSQLKCVELLIYDFMSNFPFNRGMKATDEIGICFSQFVKKWRYFIIRTVDRGCKKIFRTTLYH